MQLIDVKRNRISNWFKYRINRYAYSKKINEYWEEDGQHLLERESEELFNKKRETESNLTTSLIINSKPKKVLEYGCGYGRNLKILEKKIEDAEIYGVDISSTVLEKANEYILGKAKLKKITDNTIPFPDDFFDVSFTSGVLNVNPPKNFKKICEELIRVTKVKIFHREQQIDYQIKWKHDYESFYSKFGCKIKSFTRDQVDNKKRKFLDEDTIWWEIELPK